MATNIAKIREAQNISQVELADRLGIHVTNLNRIERGKSSPSTARLEQIARELGVAVSELVAETEPETVPIMGYVGAGAEVEPDHEQVPPEGLDQVTVPFPLPAEMIALQVKGDSMLPQFHDGAVIIVFREQRRPIDSFYGEEAVVRTSDGRRFIKTIMRGARGGVTLTSWNAQPIENVHVVWIGEIFTIFPAAALRRTASQIHRQGGIQGRLRLQDIPPRPSKTVTAANLNLLPEERFEQLVRALLDREFAHRRIQPQSSDSGVDGVAIDYSGEKAVIVTKRGPRPIGVQAVRELYGTMRRESAEIGVLVTTSTFTNEALKYASGKPLVLASGADLLAMADRHRESIPKEFFQTISA